MLTAFARPNKEDKLASHRNIAIGYLFFDILNCTANDLLVQLRNLY
jgi:hypothetical protein